MQQASISQSVDSMAPIGFHVFGTGHIAWYDDGAAARFHRIKPGPICVTPLLCIGNPYSRPAPRPRKRFLGHFFSEGWGIFNDFTTGNLFLYKITQG